MKRLVLLGLLASCGGEPREDRPRPARAPTRAPIVVFGLDGATLRVMRPMLDRGELPNFDRLRLRGTWGVLQSITPTASPIIWTTIATGVRPERHGIDGFVTRVPGRPMSTLIPVSHRKVPAIWNTAGAAGRSVGVVGWWVTWPAEDVNGFMVSHTLFLTGDEEAATHPAKLLGRLPSIAARGMDPEAQMRAVIHEERATTCPFWRLGTGGPMRPLGSRSQDDYLCTIFQNDAATVEIARTLWSENRPDILFVYVKGIDQASHAYWKYSFPDDASWRVPPEADVAHRYSDAVQGVYRFTDALLGQLLETVGDATVLVVSDHGFVPDPKCGGIDLDFTPLLRDMDLLAQGATGTDWAHTVVSPDEGGDRAGLFVNLRERSPQGIVTRAAYEKTAGDVAERLRALRTETGHPLFASVTVADGDPTARVTPDITAVPTDGLEGSDVVRVGTHRNPVKTYLHDRNLSGNHMTGNPAELEGIVFAGGPGIARRRAPIHASVFDVAPTVSCLLGVPLAVRPESPPSPLLLDPARLDACGAWSDGEGETPPGAETTAPGSGTPEPSFPGDERLREQLRGLGYVQ